tara:strand:+ start:847 stop:1602 length:756 start_codon:yes stop_codon:yes gene_type:complete
MNKILLIINKLLKKILNNKKFVNFSIILILFFISFIITNSKSRFIQALIILTKLSSIKILLILFILLISYYNFSLGLLFLITIIILMNRPSYIENFTNIPNLVDKNKILELNKNFKTPKRITDEKEDIKKEINEESNEYKNENIEEKPKKKTKLAISQDYNEDINNNVDEINLDEKEDTIENELKKKYTNEYKKLEEFDSSSSDSSNSQSSESSTDSSDSEKELDEVSMDVARNHMLNKLRSGLKKKYIND